jgi:PTH1 family peptidyl-tRNA hydrolase
MKLIVGLGNPGKEYAQTRHNAGWMALDRLAERAGTSWGKDAKLDADVAKASVDGQTAILLKPQTYMNESGRSVASAMGYYKIAAPDILLVQDEMDLAPGSLKFSAGGRPGGHNGVDSVYTALGGTAVTRLRIGVGRPTNGQDSADWVLGRADATTVETAHASADAIRDWIAGGMEVVMNRWNAKGKNEETK